MIELKHVAVVCATLKEFKDYISIFRHTDNKILCNESDRVIIEFKLVPCNFREIHYHAIIHFNDLYKLRGIENVGFEYYGNIIKTNPDLYARCEFTETMLKR